MRKLGSALAALGSLAAVLLGMAAMDVRVREQVRLALAGQGPTPEAWSSLHRLQDAVLVALDAVRDRGIEHAPLTIFALAATVLLLVMLRT